MGMWSVIDSSTEALVFGSVFSTLNSSRPGSWSASSAFSSRTPSPESFLSDLGSGSADRDSGDDDSDILSSVGAARCGGLNRPGRATWAEMLQEHDEIVNVEMDMLGDCEPGLGVQLISEVSTPFS